MVISVLPINAGNLRNQGKINLPSEFSTIEQAYLTNKISTRQFIG